jgi:beta-lactamase regulating signal transducer with metallopeptidase domain
MPTAALAAGAWSAAALLVLKSTLVLGAAALGALALRRASAASRHFVWALSLAALLALPALTLALPGWRPAVLAVIPHPSPPAPESGFGAEISRFVSTAPLAGLPASIDGRPGFPLGAVLLVVWALGAVVVLARLGMGIAAVRRVAREAEVVDDRAWTEMVERLGASVGVRRPVRLLRSGAAAMPMTWGSLRPAILLPADADGWDEERRRVVLLHELAHVARRDCLTQCLAEVACALHWFHPGAWWAARQMRLEREQACDDRVLTAGARASEYALHLLNVARAYRPPVSAAALAMARPSQLEGRLRAVLETERDRRGVTPRVGAVCAGAVALAVLPLAVVTPSERCGHGAEHVSLTVPVHAAVDASGKGTGKAKAMARINGRDVHLDLDLRLTVVPGIRSETGEAWSLPAAPDPDPARVFTSSGRGTGVKGGTPGFFTREDGAVVTAHVEKVEKEMFHLEIDLDDLDDLRHLGEETARVAGVLDRAGSSAEARKAGAAVRAGLAATLREAREREPDAVRIAEQLVDLDRVITLVGDAVAEGVSESR